MKQNAYFSKITMPSGTRFAARRVSEFCQNSARERFCQDGAGAVQECQAQEPAVPEKKSPNEQQGIVLIEVAMYILLLMFLGVLLFQGATTLHTRLAITSASAAACLSLHAAADVLSRDLHGAPARVASWKKLGPSELRWCTLSIEGGAAKGGSDIEWYFDQGRLYRAQKTYNFLKKTWGDRAVSVVAAGVTRVFFGSVLSGDGGQVIKIMFVLEEGAVSVPGVVALRNREVIS